MANSFIEGLTATLLGRGQKRRVRKNALVMKSKKKKKKKIRSCPESKWD